MSKNSKNSEIVSKAGDEVLFRSWWEKNGELLVGVELYVDDCRKLGSVREEKESVVFGLGEKSERR